MSSSPQPRSPARQRSPGPSSTSRSVSPLPPPPPLVKPTVMSAVAGEEDEAYILAMERHVAALRVPVDDRDDTSEARRDLLAAATAAAPEGPADVEVTDSATTTPPLSTSELIAVARTTPFECFCFQPSVNTDGGEPSCRHAELRLETCVFARELVSLMREEQRAWDADVAAPWAAIMRGIRRHGSAEERFRRDWEAERVRANIETLRREDDAGRQLVYSGGAPQSGLMLPSAP